MDYDLIVVKTLERVYKNYYYIIRGAFTMAKVFITLTGTKHYFGNDFLKKGKKIRLEKEPDNEYDKEAKIGCIS